MKIYIGDNIKTVLDSEGIVLGSVECAREQTNSVKYYCRDSDEIMVVDAHMINEVRSPSAALIEASKNEAMKEFIDQTILSETSVVAGDFVVCWEHEWTPDEMADALMQLYADIDEVKFTFTHCPVERLIEYHHTMGQFIRNHFLLWQNSVLQYPKGMERHPDSFSMEVIRLFREKLRA